MKTPKVSIVPPPPPFLAITEKCTPLYQLLLKIVPTLSEHPPPPLLAIINEQSLIFAIL